MTQSTAPTTADELRLDNFIPYRLSILSNLVSGAIALDYAEEFNLSIAGWRIMASLALSTDITAARLVEITKMDKVAVSRAVNSLINQDYVTREACKTDRRQSILRLSSKGKDVYRRIVPIAKKHEAHLLSGLNEEKRALLDALLTELTQKAQQTESHL